MPMNQDSVYFDVAEAWVYPLTNDVVGGASPTFGAGTRLQGIAQVMFDPNVVSATLKGDNGIVIARHGRVDMFHCSATYGRLGLPGVAVMLGPNTVVSGSGATEVASVTLGSPNTLPFFGFQARITDVDNGVGECRLIIYKGQLKSATFVDAKTDSFGQPKMDLEGIATTSSFSVDGQPAAQQIGTLKFAATAGVLSATWKP